MSFTTSQYIAYNRPSFFEVMAHDRMIPSLKFATKYILTVFAQRNPTSALWIRFLNHHEELFAVVQAFFENHFLKHYNASFSEYLYGLKRTSATIDLSRTSSGGGGDDVGTASHNHHNHHHHHREAAAAALTTRQKNVSLFNVIVVPFLKSKLDQMYRKHMRIQQEQQQQQTTDQVDSSLLSVKPSMIQRLYKQLMKLFVLMWPYCSAAYEGSFFVYMLLYLFKDIRYHSPLMHLQGLMLKRMSIIDLINDRRNMNISRLKIISLFNKRGGMWSLMTYVLRLGYVISDYSTHFLLTMAFLFKFFEWWYTSENQLKSKTTIEIPPPPTAPVRAVGGVELPQDTSLCPLCRKKRKNPTLLSLSGYAFCYTCIHQHISKNACCPITLISPATPNHLRRLYEQ